jgi:OPA family glycerol-3-phosphate transporter-like MFS transporter
VDKLLEEIVPIVILCAAITLVVSRLPKVDVGHSVAFRRRRLLNWLPLGLTYAFLYMGRYNLNALMTKEFDLLTPQEFGDISAVGAIVYGFAFFLNGPLTDRFGGRLAILVAAAGAAAANLAIGFVVASGHVHESVSTLTILFGLNMYFQSFGAVAIVKVNASWFHLRERGTFGGIFGILISLGLYFAYDWAPNIGQLTSPQWLFMTPAAILLVFLVLSWWLVRDRPSDAGFADFDVADASSGDERPPDPAFVIIKRMLTNRVILVIALISLCSGFLRQGILQWYKKFAEGVGIADMFVYKHWGMMSCIAGMLGGMFAGIVSDHLFQSRRPPVATLLFAIMLAGSCAIALLLGVPLAISWVITGMAMAIIGVHGMLSGVASQDFGGRRNAGTATGIIDGFVYFGTALQAAVYGHTLPSKNSGAHDASSWLSWPVAMIPVAVVGLALSISVYNARVQPGSAKH